MTHAEPQPAERGADPIPAPLDLRGWLGAFVTGCFVTAVSLAVGAVRMWRAPAGELDALAALVPLAAVVRGFEMTAYLLLAAALVALGVCILQHRRFAASLAVVVLAVFVAFCAADLLLDLSETGRIDAALARAGVAPTNHGFPADLAGAIVVGLLWIAYFLRSGAVRAGFGTVTLARVAGWVAGQGPRSGGQP